MKEERKVALVIQARMNSTRVPNKMIRSFAGSNLFTLALEKLSTSKAVSKNDIYVAVGDEELLDIAWEYSFNVFERTKESCDSTNDPNKPDSLTLLYEWHEFLLAQGYTHVVLVSACNPLLSIETIDGFYERFTNSELDGMFSVTEEHNFYWDKFGEPITDWKGMKLMNTRKVDPVFAGAHCLYASKLDYIADECWMGNTSPPRPELFVVNKLESTDIDTIEDFQIAEVLYHHFRHVDAEPAPMAKNWIDPIRNRSGRNIATEQALEIAHDEIKNAIEIAYYEGRGYYENVKMLTNGH